MTAILLAAGVSARMGTPKPLLTYPPGEGGEPLVRRVARALRDGAIVPVVVVVGPGEIGAAITEAVKGMDGVAVTENPRPERGMLSSVQAGIRRALLASAPAAFLVCPCDLPKLTPALVAAVTTAWQGDRETIVVPTFSAKRGHPTLFGSTFIEEVLGLAPEKYGLNVVLQRHASRVREVPVNDDAVLRDADTPEEWRALGGALPGEETR